MKTLYKKESAEYCSEVVTYKGNKFKVVSITKFGVPVSVSVYIFTQNGDIAVIATHEDMNNILKMETFIPNKEKLEINKNNIAVAKAYIKAIY